MLIVFFGSAGPANAGPGPARESDTSGQLAITKEKTQCRALHLQSVGTLALGQLLLEIFRREIVGVWIQLRQADHLVSCARPFDESDGLLLVHPPGLKGVHPPCRDGPGRALLFTQSKLGIMARFPNSHLLVEAI